MEDVLLRDLHQRAAERGLVEEVHLEEDAIERGDRGPGADLGGAAVLEIDRVRHAVRPLEHRGAREALVEHVDEQVRERRLGEGALRVRRGQGLFRHRGGEARGALAGDELFLLFPGGGARALPLLVLHVGVRLFGLVAVVR